MDTIEAMRPFCDGNTSFHDMRSLLISMGHSTEDIRDAFYELVSQPENTLRVGRYQKGEYHAEVYLTLGS